MIFFTFFVVDFFFFFFFFFYYFYYFFIFSSFFYFFLKKILCDFLKKTFFYTFFYFFILYFYFYFFKLLNFLTFCLIVTHHPMTFSVRNTGKYFQFGFMFLIRRHFMLYWLFWIRTYSVTRTVGAYGPFVLESGSPLIYHLACQMPKSI